MADITYPTASLPRPLVADYSLQDGDSISRTRMDSGYAVYRKNFTTMPVVFDVSFIMSGVQYTYLLNWMKDDLKGGAAWFNIDLLTGQKPGITHECRFLEPPKATMTGIYWGVTCTLQAIELILLEYADYDTVMLGLIESLGGLEPASIYLDIFDTFVNEDYPEDVGPF